MKNPSAGAGRDPCQLTSELVEVVADALDEDPMELPPLGAECNPEALARFLQSSADPVTVQFEVYDCLVTVAGEDGIMVDASH